MPATTKRGRTTPPKSMIPPDGMPVTGPAPGETGDPQPGLAEDEEITLIPQEFQGVRVPLPGIPLPLNFFFGLIPIGNQEVVLCTAVNDAGSMIQGYFAPEVAAKIGRDLLKAARDAEVNQSRRLVTPTKTLVVPG